MDDKRARFDEMSSALFDAEVDAVTAVDDGDERIDALAHGDIVRRVRFTRAWSERSSFS